MGSAAISITTDIDEEIIRSEAACRVRAVFFVCARMAQAAESSCEVPQQIGMLLLGMPKLYYSERKCLTFFEGRVE
jgi:hypothetical protein